MNGAVLLLSWQLGEKKQHHIRSCDMDSGNNLYEKAVSPWML